MVRKGRTPEIVTSYNYGDHGELYRWPEPKACRESFGKVDKRTLRAGKVYIA